MKLLLIPILLHVTFLSHAQKQPSSICTTNQESTNTHYTKADSLSSLLKNLVTHGVPGVALTVYSSEGWWQSSCGFAKIETQTLMQPCHLQYIQSIAKTYMAVAILKLREQGRVNLDEPITKYLPQKISNHISSANKITIKMLLNHTSGIPEYNSQPAYITYLLQHPTHYFEPEAYLEYIHQKPLDFTPGSKYSYRNTNYLLLALVGDVITGNHANYIRESIFKSLQLKQTFYRGDSGYLNFSNLVNSYWDRNSNGIVENASVLQNYNVKALVGDDGIVTTPMEAVIFLKALMEGKLISNASLELMKSWVNDRKGNAAYGLGLDYATFVGYKAYGHSSGGIGAGCQLYFFPDKNVFVFLGINLGTVTESPLHEINAKTIDKIYSTILN